MTISCVEWLVPLDFAISQLARIGEGCAPANPPERSDAMIKLIRRRIFRFGRHESAAHARCRPMGDSGFPEFIERLFGSGTSATLAVA